MAPPSRRWPRPVTPRALATRSGCTRASPTGCWPRCSATSASWTGAGAEGPRVLRSAPGWLAAGCAPAATRLVPLRATAALSHTHTAAYRCALPPLPPQPALRLRPVPVPGLCGQLDQPDGAERRPRGVLPRLRLGLQDGQVRGLLVDAVELQDRRRVVWTARHWLREHGSRTVRRKARAAAVHAPPAVLHLAPPPAPPPAHAGTRARTPPTRPSLPRSM